MSTSDRATFALLFGLSVLLAIGFVLALGPPWRSAVPRMAWLQVALAVAAGGVDALLLAAVLQVRIPIWVYAIAVLIQDGVFAWRIVVLLTERIDQRA